MSFQQISNVLKNSYGIEMSRQAVCGMYNRASKKRESLGNPEAEVIINDILRYSALGLNENRALDIVKRVYDSNKVNELGKRIWNRVDEYDKIMNMNTKWTKEILRQKGEIYDIEKALEYKGVKPTKKKLNFYIKEAYTSLLREEAIKNLKEIYSITEDKKLLMDLINNTDVVINIKEVVK